MYKELSMGFSSIVFIFTFLPIFLWLYYLMPGDRSRDIVLVAGSFIFYAFGEPVYLILLIFSAFFNYFMGLDIDKAQYDDVAKRRLIFGVIINLLILCFFKYWGFFLDTISGITGISIAHPVLSLPIGLSFYTFKNISYLADVYSQKFQAQESFLTYLVYSTMFPHMAAGPIVRYGDIEEALYSRHIDIGRIGLGAEYFIKGLAKKVLLADNLGLIFSAVSSSVPSVSMLTAWLGLGAYTLQIYLDFSGYSDMAIGLGKMLGFDFLKNFDYPYLSVSVSEFWRRWHISLGSFFRDYVYIPLGGNRVSPPAHVRNILIVWALTGLWHGASWNFVLWGVYYGILLLVEKYALNRFISEGPLIACRIYTVLSVMIGWVFFSLPSFGAIGRYFSALFGFGASSFADMTFLYYLKTGFVLFALGILCCTPFLQDRFKMLMRRRRAVAIAIDLVLLVLCIAFMVYNSYTPFLYQQF